MVRGVNLRGSGITAGLLGGLLATVAWAQSDAPSPRSVYQRRGASAQDRSPQSRAYDVGSDTPRSNHPSATEPRRLPPPALGQGAARQLPR
ncbi:MAG TPA: hypothetical protein VF306_07190, partial [Pirellulales bacterium]